MKNKRNKNINTHTFNNSRNKCYGSKNSHVDTKGLCGENISPYITANLTSDTIKDQNQLRTGIIIDGVDYSLDDITKFVRKYNAEEAAKLKTCHRCGMKYKENDQFSLVKYKLHQECDEPGAFVGYESTPYISGVKVLSTCGQGKELGFCDSCLYSFISWLDDFKNEFHEFNDKRNEVIKNE